MPRALTTKAVEALKPDPDKRREIPDPALPGLYLVVQQSGRKSWALRYRYAGKPRKLTLGQWPTMGVAAARAAASEGIESVETGGDPNAAKKATREPQDDRDQVSVLVARYAADHLSGLKSGAHVKRELERHAVAAWGDRDVGEITKRDVLDLLDGIGKTVTANRVRAYLSGFFNWCVERDILAVSPATGVKRPAKEISRERVLSDDEIRAFWKACDHAGYPWGPLGRVLLLTGQRLGEVVGMSDAEIAGDVWHLPASRTKNARAHDVPLAPAVLEILSSLPRLGDAGLIFTTTGAFPLSGFHKGHKRILDAMPAGERWTFHDLRRTAATGMARLGVSVRVTEAVLNHVSGTGGGIVAVYQRHDYASEKRAALEAWSRHLAGLSNS